MTQARIHPLPDSEWQPERHPRSDACFHSSPLGPSPRSQEMTASCWPGLAGEEVGRRAQVEKNAGPEREPRQGGRISMVLELCRENSSDLS